MARCCFKKIAAFSLILGFFACTSVMNSKNFDAVQVGTPTEEILMMYGYPQQIYQYEDGSEEYEYLEKSYQRSGVLEIRRFFFVIQNGQVTEKRCDQELSPLYNRIYESETDRAAF